ncbi:MAG: hypothetical protein Q8O46_01160 [bacterium]|nr:hypothetical protein [bacterium]
MEPEQKSNGALVGSIIVIIILILGGLYFLKTKVETEPVPGNTGTLENAPLENEVMQKEATTSGEIKTSTPTAPAPVSTSSDTSSIEQELNSMDLESLDAEI